MRTTPIIGKDRRMARLLLLFGTVVLLMAVLGALFRIGFEILTR